MIVSTGTLDSTGIFTEPRGWIWLLRGSHAGQEIRIVSIKLPWWREGPALRGLRMTREVCRLRVSRIRVGDTVRWRIDWDPRYEENQRQ